MKKAFNEDVARIIISVLLFIISLFLPSTPSLIFLILSYIIISYEIYMEAFENLKEKEIFNEIINLIHCFAMKVYSSRRQKKLKNIEEDLKIEIEEE